MSEITAKWISSIVLFISTLAVSLLPVIAFNYFSKLKQKRHVNCSIRKGETFNISSANSQSQRCCANLSATSDDNDSITGSGDNVIRRTRSNSISSISSISSRKLNKNSAAILQIFMFFGGGILLATCFCHLIPEIKENFENYLIKNLNHSHHHHDHIHDHSKAYNPSSTEESSEISTEVSNNFDTAILTPTITPSVSMIYKRNISDIQPISTSLQGDSEHVHDNDDFDHDESESNHTHTHKHSVPWIEIGICAGFFLIYFIEEIVHIFVNNHKNNFEKHTTCKSESIVGVRWDLPYQTKSDSGTHLVHNNSNKQLPCYDNYAIDFNSEPQLSKELSNKKNNLSGRNTPIRQNDAINQNKLATDNKLLPASVRFMQGFVTIIAFSAHSIFDGLAIGLQSTTNQIYTMLFAISMHKLVVAFAVGLELFDQTSSVYMTAIHMSIFSIMSPIGIWIVIFSQKTADIPVEDQSLLLIMLSAVATGTIIYIVFFEILQKDRSGSNVNGVILWFVMIFGFLTMLLINIFVSG